MDIYGVIKQDHDLMRSMLNGLCQTGNGEVAQREAQFTPLRNELMMHQQVEEAVLYDSLKDVEETRPDALEAIAEHHLVNGLLEELALMPKDSDEWFAKFGVLKELVEHHMREEEEDFFAAAKKVIGDDQAVEMGRQMRAKKEAGIRAIEAVG
jgi:hemerythrin superfamily protein